MGSELVDLQINVLKNPIRLSRSVPKFADTVINLRGQNFDQNNSFQVIWQTLHLDPYVLFLAKNLRDQ